MSEKRIVSYGRRRGRKLRAGKQALMDNLLPSLVVGSKDIEQLGSYKADLAVALGFINTQLQEFQMEIGFGGGEHLAVQAKLHPDIGFIGCEPYINGVGDLLKRFAECPDNIKIYQGDARDVIAALPDGCLSKAFILFPDPWPKTRHHKRRLIQQPFLEMLARVMKKGAVLQLATDHSDYLTWMLEQLLINPHFVWNARGPEDWNTPPADWVETKYQQKAQAEGRGATFLQFSRR